MALSGGGRLDEFDGLAVRETDEGLLPVLGAAGSGTAGTLLLALVVRGADVGDLLAEEPLDRILDLKLVGPAIHLEDVFVLLLGEQSGLLAQLDRIDDLEN